MSVVDLSIERLKRSPDEYYVTLCHFIEDDRIKFSVQVDGVETDDKNRLCVAKDLREAADMIEEAVRSREKNDG